MKSGRSSGGFTIIEVMIFLAISMALLGAALIFVNGHQQTTEFNQSINDIKTQIDQIINNVATGYYAKTTNFDCKSGANGPIPFNFGSGTDSRGTNQDCIFIGRAIQFGVQGTNQSGYNVYDLIGLRDKSGTNNDVSSLIEAKPIALAQGNLYNSTIPSGIEENNVLQYGLKVLKMKYTTTTNNTLTPTGVVAFVTDFANAAGPGLASGTRQAGLYIVHGTTANPSETSNAVADSMDRPNAANFSLPVAPDQVNKVSICFDGAGAYYAILDIGGTQSQLTTNLRIADKNSPPQECT